MKSFNKLKLKLSELFQLDQADLDFGIYRVMNARRDEVKRFLESDLFPQVREAFTSWELGSWELCGIGVCMELGIGVGPR
jgi:adenine-specific DNA-methyltransferase